jgi:phage shock protein A
MQKKGIKLSNLRAINLGLKEDLIKLIAKAKGYEAPAIKITDNAQKISDQVDAIKTKASDFSKQSGEMLRQMQQLGAKIEADYNDYQTQLKQLGVPKEAVADLESAISSLNSTDFFNVQKDLSFWTETLKKFA